MDHNDGRENGAVGDCYTRSLTSDELDLVERDCAAGEEEDLTADETARDAYFAALPAELEDEKEEPPFRRPGLDPGSAFLPMKMQMQKILNHTKARRTRRATWPSRLRAFV